MSIAIIKGDDALQTAFKHFFIVTSKCNFRQGSAYTEACLTMAEMYKSLRPDDKNRRKGFKICHPCLFNSFQR